MKLAIVGLSGVLLLTGCASSPSLEDQASLIEYQACLDEQVRIDQEIDKLFGNKVGLIARGEALVKQGRPDPKSGLLPIIESRIKNCEKYRP